MLPQCFELHLPLFHQSLVAPASSAAPQSQSKPLTSVRLLLQPHLVSATCREVWVWQTLPWQRKVGCSALVCLHVEMQHHLVFCLKPEGGKKINICKSLTVQKLPGAPKISQVTWESQWKCIYEWEAQDCFSVEFEGWRLQHFIFSLAFIL